MNKQELIAAIAKARDVSLKQAEECLDTVVDTICGSLKKGEEVKIAGFGVFTVKDRKARTGVVPGHAERVKIPARKTVGFRVSKLLKDEL